MYSSDILEDVRYIVKNNYEHIPDDEIHHISNIQYEIYRIRDIILDFNVIKDVLVSEGYKLDHENIKNCRYKMPEIVELDKVDKVEVDLILSESNAITRVQVPRE